MIHLEISSLLFFFPDKKFTYYSSIEVCKLLWQHHPYFSLNIEKGTILGENNEREVNVYFWSSVSKTNNQVECFKYDWWINMLVVVQFP